MENASKALIIAGAILLAIVLVSLGVLVINNSRKDITDNNMEEATIGTFNKNITQYCGKHKSGTEMTNLIRAIISSNAVQSKKPGEHYIGCNTKGVKNGLPDDHKTEWTVAAIKSGFKNNNLAMTSLVFSNSEKYDALYKMGSDGYINFVTITSN